jgi:hypothetical protein
MNLRNRTCQKLKSLDKGLKTKTYQVKGITTRTLNKKGLYVTFIGRSFTRNVVASSKDLAAARHENKHPEAIISAIKLLK